MQGGFPKVQGGQSGQTEDKGIQGQEEIAGKSPQSQDFQTAKEVGSLLGAVFLPLKSGARLARQDGNKQSHSARPALSQ